MALTREVTCIFNLISECCLLLFNVQLFLLFFLYCFHSLLFRRTRTIILSKDRKMLSLGFQFQTFHLFWIL